MTQRQAGLVTLALLAAVLIALFLQNMVEQVIIRPAAYLWWLLGIIYRFIPQPITWILLVLSLLYFLLGDVARKIKPINFSRSKPIPVRGPVDELSEQIRRKNGGIYFKWQIARTLAEIALDLQELRQHSHGRKLDFGSGPVNPDVRRYLEAGLNTSFSDYPMTARLPLIQDFVFTAPTPFDGDIHPVIDYLENSIVPVSTPGGE